jgi:predicted DCC family thiol-disulfide oxidoreductase YuxK
MLDCAEGAVGRLTVIYDGDCPLCRAYVTHVRLQRSAGSVILVDARTNLALVSSLAQRGYNLEDGMVVQLEERIYHGAAAVHLLALLSSRSGWFNRFNYRIFRSQTLSSILYPLLAMGRRILLWLIGKKPLPPSDPSTPVKN